MSIIPPTIHDGFRSSPVDESVTEAIRWLWKSRPPEARRHGGGGDALDGRYAGGVSFESCIGAGLVDGVGGWG